MAAQEPRPTVSRTRSMACPERDNHLPAGRHRVAADQSKFNKELPPALGENSYAHGVWGCLSPERPRRAGGAPIADPASLFKLANRIVGLMLGGARFRACLS